jgi:membrane protein implicated in regulation of membrane protease activity
MFEWLGENWWALWLSAFLAFAVIEMITLDLFFIMLGGGTLAAMVADFAGADPWLQIVVFCVVSLLMIAFVRPVALSHLKKGPSDGGLVKIGGDIWSARSAAGVLPAGQKVVVAAIDGATAVVSAASDADGKS